ncbi:MAG: MFS transporter permease [Stygiobacter sp. RIFOXYC12_FULL_38_8]|nr:MAG: MFS transporter permease [Stygiobacter sp. RIFOXYA12_FULL_38_9]OGV09603.1 MAG: MFS transporter permease [Stygiobacter sp. RIFOXYB2_FULL_37_11]OGV16733.1 MAG: MFS transporter permease [Stygiobacter sp. RIFOXYC2_FULL_38_25]OGV18163.1 MAG: MFS transporter permease [Stygiobacter sp. RIFOXYA2_FULL_38_8]OGV24861.1 MAG: MFS transporter permease [Stygiobacter sp. RIFOXYC12_FULL_38_8]OGV82916.1 MAG: MFS transporter permease [Stygiobacter sp. GWF2_38_21]RJQ62977.1 MAG: MFS transporter [Stygioba
MNLSAEIQKLKSGFHPSFWVANVMELFERLAYYGQQIVFMIYLRNNLHFTETEAGQLSGIFGGLIYLLPILGGTLADKWGFKKAFNVAFTILGIGYFLIGSMGLSVFSSFYSSTPNYWLLMLFLIFTAFGGSFIKPSVLGTVAVASKDSDSKSLGFAIYYWLVNAGAMIGPTIAYLVRDSFGNEFVYMVSAISCFAMLVVNMIFYKDVHEPSDVETLAKKIANLFVVLRNYKFMIFLFIYSLYWIIFWQEFIIVPYYVTDYISATAPYEIIQSWAGAGAIILLQIPVNRFTKNLHTSKAIMYGFAISSLIWIVIGIYPSIPTIVAGIVAFAIGEMVQAPRYYEYISEIAPEGQQGLYQGFAFLPIAIARFAGDPFGGWLYQTSKASGHPEYIWFSMIGIGLLSVLLMYLYNKFLVKAE